MKTCRFVSILVVILVVLQIASFSAAYGEEERFTIRNGIMFGMTQDDVNRIEEQNGLSGDGRKYSKVNVAGIDNATIDYYYDEDALTQITYYWRDAWHSDTSFTKNTFDIDDLQAVLHKQQSRYETLQEALSSKYELIGTMTGDKVSFTEFPGGDYFPFQYLESSSMSENEYIGYGFNQYLAADGDDYVEIILKFYEFDKYPMFRYDSTPPNDVIVEVAVVYHSIPKDLMEEMLDEGKRIQEKRDSDL